MAKRTIQKLTPDEVRLREEFDELARERLLERMAIDVAAARRPTPRRRFFPWRIRIERVN